MSDKQELKGAFISGYNLGHEHTVEGGFRYCDEGQSEVFEDCEEINTRHNEFNDKTRCVKLSKDGVADWCMGDAAIDSLAEHLKLIKELKDKIAELESRHTEQEGE